MHQKLKQIIATKHQEVAQLQARQLRSSFKRALTAPGLSVIAEVKRASPSKGHIAAIESVTELAAHYVTGGASAISVLTDKDYFNGSIDDLIAVKKSVVDRNVPVLRKDFIIDQLQIAEACHAGADAVLLIVAVLGEKVAKFLDICHMLGMDALMEVHTEEECAIAVEAGADIIGINNRDLDTFTVDVDNAFKLKTLLPDDVITVAESGILEPDLAQAYSKAGFDAVLVGEALVKAESPEQFIEAMRVTS